MLFQNQLLKRNYFSPIKHSETHFQWKKASKNLQNFIQSEQFNLLRSHKSPQEHRTNSIKKQKVSLMRSMQNIHFSNKQTERQSPEVTLRQKQQNLNILLKERNNKKHQNIQLPNKKQHTKIQQQKSIQKSCQTFDHEFPSRKRENEQQKNCLKDLIQILQKQVISYSKVISENHNKINKLNFQIQNLKNQLKNQNQRYQRLNDKFNREVELTKGMEYIIEELNQKIKILLSHNLQLLQKIDQLKDKESRNLPQTFSQSQVSLSMNSQIHKKSQNSELFKNTDSIIQLQSNIPVDDKSNWSLSGLDISMFNKTPNKVHEASVSQQYLKNQSSISSLQFDQQIDDIIIKHKIEINKLNQKLKYYEIENQMLRRKKQMSQKNTLQIQQLKHRIQKLSEQNKIIKLLQQNKKKKSKTQGSQNGVSQSQMAKQTNKKRKQNQKSVEKCNLKEESKLDQSNKQEESLKQKQNSPINDQKKKLNRKSPLQRKFVRKPNKSSPRNQKNVADDDSQISLEFSPQRI